MKLSVHSWLFDHIILLWCIVSDMLCGISSSTYSIKSISFLENLFTDNKERRKVQLVEQPGQKTASKSQPINAAPANQRRPITADEI